MTIDRTYRCDLCHDMHEPGKLRGLFWRTTASGSELVEKPSREVEHHVCPKCLTGLRNFELSR